MSPVKLSWISIWKYFMTKTNKWAEILIFIGVWNDALIKNSPLNLQNQNVFLWRTEYILMLLISSVMSANLFLWWWNEGSPTKIKCHFSSRFCIALKKRIYKCVFKQIGTLAHVFICRNVFRRRKKIIKENIPRIILSSKLVIVLLMIKK